MMQRERLNRLQHLSTNMNALGSRREFLRIGGSGLLGLSLARMLQAADGLTGTTAANGSVSVGRADSLIVLFLNGGPSHLDMWDMKPDGPAESRGEFKPIETSQPGVLVSEHMPKLAPHMHRAALVRSMNHSVNNAHALAVYTSLTGHDKGDANRIVGNGDDDQPSPGSILSMIRPTAPEVTPYVALPYKTKEGAGGPPQPGFFGGWAGRNFDPLWVLKDPNADDFAVPELTLPGDVSIERMSERGRLLAEFNARAIDAATRPPFRAMNRFQQQAADILTAPTTRDAFRIQDEDAATRERYGRNIYGQSVLLARRLIEAGTRVVTLSWAPDANATWDTHAGNFAKLRETLLPQFDMACAALLDDLAQRGRLDRTLVAVLGDFGRTPKINGNNAGRDHWNYCYTVMLAGGGVRPGFVYGASDKAGAFPADKPATPADLIATIYGLCGVDSRTILYDRVGRPHPIVKQGTALDELIA